MDGGREPGKAVICCRWNDEDYRRTRCPPDVFQQKFGRHGIEKVYRSDNLRSDTYLNDTLSRDDILPCRVYLRHCYLAAKNLISPVALDNFLDNSFLGDRETTIREYLNRHPEILTTEPPASVAPRYSG